MPARNVSATVIQLTHTAISERLQRISGAPAVATGGKLGPVVSRSEIPMSIRDWPRTERPRERLIEHGPNALSDGELLAVLISCGHGGRSAVDLARELIDKFGSLREFLMAEPSSCLGQLGIGPARYASMQAALELARRHYREPLRGGCGFKNAEAVRAFLQAQLRDRPQEVFCCLFLNPRLGLFGLSLGLNGDIGGVGGGV